LVVLIFTGQVFTIKRFLKILPLFIDIDSYFLHCFFNWRKRKKYFHFLPRYYYGAYQHLNISQMATANIKTLCSSCGKPNGRVTCEGCSKLFCLNDFNGHRQELGTQLDAIEVDRDLFRQMLTENVSKPQNHALMKQIDEWENESINKIRQAAGEARKILTDHTAKLQRKLEEKLEMLTNELRQSRQENDFFEPNLSRWTEELVRMKDDLTRPSSIAIRNDPTPLVTKITVDVSGKIFNYLFNRGIIVSPHKMSIHVRTHL
jgi:hypothetical protein